MDITEYDVIALAEKGATFELIAPNGDVLGVTVKMVGFDSEAVVAAGRQFDVDNVAEKKTEHPSDYDRRRRAAVVNAAVVDWGGLSIGEKLDRTNAEKYIGKRNFSWVADQCYAFGMQRANFMPPKPKP